MNDTNATDLPVHRGSCHCGHLTFSVRMDATKASRCNCRICTKLGTLGAIVSPAQFTFAGDRATLSRYGNEVGTRYFCPTCGVHAFSEGHLDILGGDFVSINVNTLDDVDQGTIEVGYWDGRHDNWQAGLRPTPWPIA
jgi:hypothetical protein